MSIVPLASQCALNNYLTWSNQTLKQNKIPLMLATEWIKKIKRESQDFLREIPEVKETGKGQDIRVHDNSFKKTFLFSVDKNKE